MRSAPAEHIRPDSQVIGTKERAGEYWNRRYVAATLGNRRYTVGVTADLEEGSELQLDFTKLDRVAGSHVVPCAVQNVDTKEVILVSYVNDEALHRSVQTRSATFWSTSRSELWEKGATSGETFELVEVRVNCEQNSLIFLVRPR